MKTYKAPWSASLVVISMLATLILVSAAIALIWKGRGIGSYAAVVPLTIICAAALFIVRAYSVTSEAILIHRSFWITRLPLVGLQSARFEPRAMRRSIRTFGNGGLFAFTGWFCNAALGRYRAFVTDPNRTVVLQLSRGTVVVSPSAPSDFVRSVTRALHADKA